MAHQHTPLRIVTTDILGVPIATNKKRDIKTVVQNFCNDGQQHIIVTPNPEFLIMARNDANFRKILQQSDLAIPDGTGLKMASCLFPPAIQERFTGWEMVHFLSELAEQKNYTLYLLGGIGDTAKRAAEKLQHLYPKLRIAGAHQGFLPNERFNAKKDNELITKIRSKKPDILLVALGAPKQEHWIADHIHKFPSVKVAIGVGGVFNSLAKNVPTAPEMLKRIGLEWLWRLATEPWRLQRIFRAVIVFPYIIIKEKIFHRHE